MALDSYMPIKYNGPEKCKECLCSTIEDSENTSLDRMIKRSRERRFSPNR